jgi:hypothetical protein
MWYDLNSCFFLMNWDKCWSRNVKSTKGLPSLLTMSFLFNVLIAGEARTILLLHIISARPSKQPLMVRTFLKAYMELGSYFVSARTNNRHHHQLHHLMWCAATTQGCLRSNHSVAGLRAACARTSNCAQIFAGPVTRRLRGEAVK